MCEMTFRTGRGVEPTNERHREHIGDGQVVCTVEQPAQRLSAAAASVATPSVADPSVAAAGGVTPPRGPRRVHVAGAIRLLVSASSDKTCRVWHLDTYAPLRTLSAHRGGLYSLAVSTRGDLTRGDLARGDLTRGDLTRGDLARGDLTRGDLTRGDLTRGGPRVCSGSLDETVRVWRLDEVMDQPPDEAWHA